MLDLKLIFENTEVGRLARAYRDGKKVSVFGMSEFTAFLTGSKWFVGYPLFVFAMLLLALFIYWLITRSDRNG